MKQCDVHNFTFTELLIYDYIIEHYKEMASISIRELSGKVNVSSASILRCIKKMGYESFTEFRFAAKEDKTKRENRKVFHTIDVARDFFSRPLGEEYKPLLDQACQMIGKSDMLLFLGVGTSGILAEYGARQFSNIGKQAFHIKDPFYPFQTIFNTSQYAVAMILSVSGESEEVISQVTALKALNCTIISLTADGHNTIAKLSNLNIPYHVAQEKVKGVFNITTQVPVVFLLESLAKKIYQSKFV